MEWLNLQTSLLHAPDYIGAEPVARATWANVSLWCAQQENGGRIVACADWNDRRWQQTCGVMRVEIDASAPLLSWDGPDLIVWRYPVEKEREVQAKRAAGKRTVEMRWGGAKPEHNGKANSSASSSANSSAKSSASSSADTERKGREGKGKEGNNTPETAADAPGVGASGELDLGVEAEPKPKRFTPPTPEEVTAYATEIGYPLNGQAWCDSYAQKGWMVGKAKMKDWRAAVRNWKANGWTPNGSKPNPSSTYEAEKRMHGYDKAGGYDAE